MKPAALLLCAALSLPAAAEPLHYNLLRFSETASRSVPNDQMTLRLRVQSRHSDAARAAADTTRKLNLLQSRLRALPGTEAELEGRSAYPVYGDGSRNPRAWEDSAVLRVSGSDFQALGKLAAQSSGEAVVDSLHFSLKPDTARRLTETLSTEVLQRFRQRAQTLSGAMGGSGFRVVEISLQQDLSADAAAKAAPSAARAYSAAEHMPEPVFDTPGTSTVSQTANGVIQY